MPLKVARVYFNDTPSKYNKELISFLHRNIEKIVTKGMLKIEPYIIKPSDIRAMRDKGIERYPAMIIGHQSAIGVSNIVNTIQKMETQKQSCYHNIVSTQNTSTTLLESNHVHISSLLL